LRIAGLPDRSHRSESPFPSEGLVLNRRLLISASFLLAGCGALPSAPLLSTTDPQCSDDGGIPLSLGNWEAGGIALASLPFAAAIAPPIQADGSSVFQIPSTIPFKIRVIACTPDGNPNGLTPTFTLERVGDDGASSTPVTILESSSAVDEGNTLRSAGEGQYLFNFSTKRSGFGSSGLIAGLYRLRIGAGGAFDDVVVEFRLRKS
jgi:hypothetical protein